MSLLPEQIAILRRFLKKSNFKQGAVILDLDGTVLQEIDSKVFISGAVERGVRSIASLGRPVIMNTLRFPLSIVRLVAPEWLKMASSEIPVVLLNGSITGIVKEENGKISFFETAAYPLHHEEIKEIISGLLPFVENGLDRIDIFCYPRDWKKGELVWVPRNERIAYIRKKYLSACQVVSCPLEEFQDRLLSEDICMISTLVDHPREQFPRMAYQHQNPSDHFTHRGVDKSFGLRELARKINIALMDSIGGGDTRMDNFLNDTGLTVIVGESNNLKFRGRRGTLWVEEPVDLGELLSKTAEIAMNMK